MAFWPNEKRKRAQKPSWFLTILGALGRCKYSIKHNFLLGNLFFKRLCKYDCPTDALILSRYLSLSHSLSLSLWFRPTHSRTLPSYLIFCFTFFANWVWGRNGQASKPASKRGYKGKMEINSRKKEKPTINRLHQHQLHSAKPLCGTKKRRKNWRRGEEEEIFSQKLARA